MSRYWITPPNFDENDAPLPYGAQTLGIVDDEMGGIIAYTHKEFAATLIKALESLEG